MLLSKAVGPTVTHNGHVKWDGMIGMSYSAGITPNSTQVGGTHFPAGHPWPTVSFAKASKAARRLVEGGLARPRWLIKTGSPCDGKLAIEKRHAS